MIGPKSNCRGAVTWFFDLCLCPNLSRCTRHIEAKPLWQEHTSRRFVVCVLYSCTVNTAIMTERNNYYEFTRSSKEEIEVENPVFFPWYQIIGMESLWETFSGCIGSEPSMKGLMFQYVFPHRLEQLLLKTNHPSLWLKNRHQEVECLGLISTKTNTHKIQTNHTTASQEDRGKKLIRGVLGEF